MIKLFLATVPPALIIVFAIVLLWPMHAFGKDPICKAGEVKASWYGAESGDHTATGMPFNGRQMIVAHKTLPFGTRVRFTYRGRSIVLPVRDRGPYIRGRVFDLSEAAARALGTKAAGVACVVAKVLR